MSLSPEISEELHLFFVSNSLTVLEEVILKPLRLCSSLLFSLSDETLTDGLFSFLVQVQQDLIGVTV